MDKERAKLAGAIIAAVVLGGCSVAFVMGSGRAVVDNDHDVDSTVKDESEETKVIN